MSSCSTSAWPPRLVTVPGLHGSEGAHWQTWLERQLPKSRRVDQDDWDAIAQGLTGDAVAGVLFVAPASPDKFRFAGAFEPRRLGVPSVLIASMTDPWMPFDQAMRLASQLGSAFVNLGDAGHINTAAGFGPWPRAKYFVDTLIHCAAPAHFAEQPDVFDRFERVEQAAYG